MKPKNFSYPNFVLHRKQSNLIKDQTYDYITNMNENNSANRKHTSSPITLVGVGAGIAAYKTVDMVSQLRKTGADVHVTMTENAQKFVGPLTFSGVSGHHVLTNSFPVLTKGTREDFYPHLYPATYADCFVLAPATANLIGKMVQGLGDNIVTTSILSLSKSCHRFFCPAMNVEMWENERVQSNIKVLEHDGWQRIGPETGLLACGMEGIGRMAEPSTIVQTIQEAMMARPNLSGKKVLILSGPTREHIDPVRFIGNPSSGRMGKAIAEEATASGAKVDFVTGPISDMFIPRGPKINIHPIVSTEQMLSTSQKYYNQADIVIYVAAVADYAPMTQNGKKLAKANETFSIPLKATPDISATLNAAKRKEQVTIGFALQTHDGHEEAREKLHNKQLDGIVLNFVDAIANDTGSFSYLDGTNGKKDFQKWGPLNKLTCAQRIIKEAATLIEKKSQSI